jgi:small subunit ribosomal protein S21
VQGSTDRANPSGFPEAREEADMATAIRRDGESFEGLFRRFRKHVQQEKILKEIRKRRFFEKPSQERKRKARKKLIKSRRTTWKDRRARY